MSSSRTLVSVGAGICPADTLRVVMAAAVPFSLTKFGDLLLPDVAAVPATVGPDTEWFVAISYMELRCHSGSLADVILHRQLAWQEKLRVILKAAECVFTVHACGVNHRCVWPNTCPLQGERNSWAYAGASACALACA